MVSDTASAGLGLWNKGSRLSLFGVRPVDFSGFKLTEPLFTAQGFCTTLKRTI